MKLVKAYNSVSLVLQHEADAVVGFDEFHFFLLLFSFPVFASESL